MKLFKYTRPCMIVADEGKMIRGKDDVYEPEHVDENGNIIPEHFPHYSTTIFVPESFTEKQMNDLYIEEIVG